MFLCFSESAIVCLLVSVSGHAVNEFCSRSAMSAKMSLALRRAGLKLRSSARAGVAHAAARKARLPMRLT
jgi:hypothetical protein